MIGAIQKGCSYQPAVFYSLFRSFVICILLFGSPLYLTFELVVKQPYFIIL